MRTEDEIFEEIKKIRDESAEKIRVLREEMLMASWGFYTGCRLVHTVDPWEFVIKEINGTTNRLDIRGDWLQRNVDLPDENFDYWKVQE